MGHGDKQLIGKMKNRTFKVEEVFFIGLKSLHVYQEKFLNDTGVYYEIQEKEFVSNDSILKFINKFNHILVNLEIDVLVEDIFHSTYTANPDIGLKWSRWWKDEDKKFTEILKLITDNSDVVNLTIAEYFPFNEHKHHKMFLHLIIKLVINKYNLYIRIIIINKSKK
ncbi:hypothetical protein HMPREF3224_00419 [Anaerococcus hydrogenalis]|nr:hypothetical protein HMPREF3224_00419 [Anaerococcus hydrogenalis]